MKNFLLRILLFCFVLIPIYCGLLLIWSKFTPKFFQNNLPYKGSVGYLDRRLLDLQSNFIDSPQDSLDILFIGSSRSYRHYDPREFAKAGYKIFNSGSSSQTLIQTEILARKYIPILKPRLVLIDIYPNSFNNDGVESSLDLISNSEKPYEYTNLVWHHQNMKTFNTLLYSEMREILNMQSLKPLRNIDKYIPGGYVERKLSYSKPESVNIQYQFRKDQIQAFTRLKKFLLDNNINAYFIHSPMQSGVNLTGPSIKNFIEGSNFRYFDFKNVPGLNDSLHFYNSSHLNQIGTHEYDKILIEILEN